MKRRAFLKESTVAAAGVAAAGVLRSPPPLSGSVPCKLPVAGVAATRRVLDPQLPSNELMKRTLKDKDL